MAAGVALELRCSFRAAALTILARSSSSSSSPTSSLTSSEYALISDAVSMLKNLRSKSKWNHVGSLYPQGISPSHVSHITLLLRNTPHLAIRFFHWTRSASLCTDHSLLSFSAIIHVAARARLRSHAISLTMLALRTCCSISTRPPELFRTLATTYRSYDSSPFVFEWLIVACLQSNRLDQALAVVRALRRRSIFPQHPTACLLILSVSRLYGPAAGHDVFREIFEGEAGVLRPSVDIFNQMMHSFQQEGMAESVEMVLEEMKSFDCEPDSYSRSILMAAYCDAGRMEEAKKLFDELHEPDVVAYNTMIGGFFKAGEVEKAVNLFERMEMGGVDASEVTFEKLINGYCGVSDMKSAMLAFLEMKMKGFHPMDYTVEAMIVGFCHLGKVSQALEFFESAVTSSSYSPTQRIYLLLVQGFLDEGRVREAVMLKEEMVKNGLPPSPDIQRAFLNSYMKNQNLTDSALL